MSKTHFRPDTHGFAFVNSWSFNSSESHTMSSAMSGAIDDALNVLLKPLAAIGGPLVSTKLQEWVGSAVPRSYGLCGGMAFAALDYYKTGEPIPRGKNRQDRPEPDHPQGKVLRDYLWKRQIESMVENGPTLLAWMGMLHSLLPFGGAGWLLDRTKEEWATLKQHIDRDEPWPLCLVGTSISPFNNHQVLAYGYDDPGDGTGIIYLYDMNCPDRETKIYLDLRGAELVAQEECPCTNRGELRGFFCEVYREASPPTVTAWSGDNAQAKA